MRSLLFTFIVIPFSGILHLTSKRITDAILILSYNYLIISEMQSEEFFVIDDLYEVLQLSQENEGF